MLAAILAGGLPLGAPAGPAQSIEEVSVPRHARGEFDVKLEPLPTDAAPAVSRHALIKTYHGDLAADARGEMLSAGGGERSGAYVAIERVTGTLGGRKGSFVLEHRGIMTRGTPDLAIGVVPDSGTDELVGLAGTMRIVITGGTHHYELDYTLPDGS